MVMAQSLFMTMKDQHPSCQIDVLAPEWTSALLAKMPQVRQAIPLPTMRGQFGIAQRYQLGKRLQPENYDQAIVLPNSWKSALVPFFANIPVRTGYIGECRWGLLNDARKLDKSVLTMTVQRFVALGLAKNAPLPPNCPMPRLIIDNSQQPAAARKFQLNTGVKILALCPGAEYGAAKRWPVAHYAEVAKQKAAQGWQVWLLGSDKDNAVAEQINRTSGNVCRNFAGHTSLAEAVELMSMADVVVSNDSGLMHIAAALDKDIIALYGSSDPGFTPPLNQKAHIISLQLDCAPCFKRECPLYPPGHASHTQCLTGINPGKVLDVLGSIH
jgi:heptosyltransferase-2